MRLVGNLLRRKLYGYVWRSVCTECVVASESGLSLLTESMRHPYVSRKERQDVVSVLLFNKSN